VLPFPLRLSVGVPKPVTRWSGFDGQIRLQLYPDPLLERAMAQESRTVTDSRVLVESLSSAVRIFSDLPQR
jgi:hypothetical protein